MNCFRQLHVILQLAGNRPSVTDHLGVIKLSYGQNATNFAANCNVDDRGHVNDHH
jgi:hypothetical protein